MKTRLQLNDEQWSRIEFILPGRECHPGRTASDNRAFVEAVLYVARTGIPWRDFGPRKEQREIDKETYKARNRIERFFCRIKEFRRIASFVLLVGAIVWVKMDRSLA